MFRFIIFIAFFVVILMLLAGVSVVRTFRSIFTGGNPQTKNKQQANKQQATSKKTNQQYTSPTRKKIIDKDEGEYVDYEEIKEEKK